MRCRTRKNRTAVCAVHERGANRVSTLLLFYKIRVGIFSLFGPQKLARAFVCVRSSVLCVKRFIKQGSCVRCGPAAVGRASGHEERVYSIIIYRRKGGEKENTRSGQKVPFLKTKRPPPGGVLCSAHRAYYIRSACVRKESKAEILIALRVSSNQLSPHTTLLCCALCSYV